MKFLEALLRDIFMLAFLASQILPKIKLVNKNRALPRHAAVIVANLCEAMQQCRRLKSCPELFPSLTVRSEFLQHLSGALPAMAMIHELLNLKHVFDSYRMGDFALEDNPNEENLDKIPHPNLRDGKNPWNKWLDNSAKAQPGWIGIQQKIPRFGHILMKRITLEYDAIEADFTRVCCTAFIRCRFQCDGADLGYTE